MSAFEEGHRDDFGALEWIGEKIGTPLGMRENFRTGLRRILDAPDWNWK